MTSRPAAGQIEADHKATAEENAPVPHIPPESRLPLSRRNLLLTAGPVLALSATAVPAATLPELTVTEALRERRSIRVFGDRKIDPALLAELLWAVFGINRPTEGLHTAPSWRGAADLIVHAATEDGVVVYEPTSDTLRVWNAGDIRARLSPQPFVGTAAVCLIYVSDLRRLEAAGSPDQQQLYARVDAAMAAQNAYLFAAARGLGTCLVGGIDSEAISGALGLAPHEFATFVQPIGWPA